MTKINADEFLKYAEAKQHQIIKKPIDFRTAANRAYYFAFNATKHFIDKILLLPSNLNHANDPILDKEFYSSGEHKKLIMRVKFHDKYQFKNINSILLADLAEDLKKCKDIRAKADYYLDKSFDEKDMDEAILLAKSIQIKIKTIKKP